MAEKLFFARLRVRLVLHFKAAKLFGQCFPQKNPIVVLCQFLILKHAAFLYDTFRSMLQGDSPDCDPSNPFSLGTPENWQNFTQTQSFLNIVDILLKDTDDCLSELTNMYYICESAFSLMPDTKKAEMNNFIGKKIFHFPHKKFFRYPEF
jgi:hypothetical protein